MKIKYKIPLFKVGDKVVLFDGVKVYTIQKIKITRFTHKAIFKLNIGFDYWEDDMRKYED